MANDLRHNYSTEIFRIHANIRWRRNILNPHHSVLVIYARLARVILVTIKRNLVRTMICSSIFFSPHFTQASISSGSSSFTELEENFYELSLSNMFPWHWLSLHFMKISRISKLWNVSINIEIRSSISEKSRNTGKHHSYLLNTSVKTW